MIDLSKLDRSRQCSVWVEGEEYLIHTEFPYWLAFGKRLEALNGEGYPVNELAQYFKVIENDGKFYGLPENYNAAYEELLNFYLNEQPLPKDVGKKSKVRILDYDIDSEKICEVFLRLYKIDLENTNIHWHKFQGLLYAYLYNLENIIDARRYEEQPEYTQKEQQKLDKQKYKDRRDMWKLESLEPEKELFEMR